MENRNKSTYRSIYIIIPARSEFRLNQNVLPRDSEKKIPRTIFMNVSLFETTFAYVSLRNERSRDEIARSDLCRPI